MGYSISWIALRGTPKAEVLARLRLRDTSELDEANESPASGAELPTGWYVVFLNDLTHPFVTPATLQKLSEGCEVIGCQVEEHVMFSASFHYSNGRQDWSITHDSQKGLYNLELEGATTSFVAELHAAAKREQDKEGGKDGGVDHIFDVPLATAERLCGYRHDRWKFDWGEPQFTTLVMNGGI
jgi:hypothetical protein